MSNNQLKLERWKSFGWHRWGTLFRLGNASRTVIYVVGICIICKTKEAISNTAVERFECNNVIQKQFSRVAY